MKKKAKPMDALQSALTLFEHALDLDPQNVSAMIGRATCLTWRANAYWSDDRAGDIARAEETIDRALTLEPNNSSAHNERASSSKRRNNGVGRSLRLRPPPPRTTTTPTHMRLRAFASCFSSKRRSG
jgi:tetratricopeptide (TPR) repeat protein